MADRAAARLIVDLGFAAAIIACGVTTYAMTRSPTIPPSVCSAPAGGPRYDELLADGRVTVAAVFGELVGGPNDPNAWSYRAFVAGLRARGFAEVEVDRYQLGDFTVDVALIADDLAQSTAALAGALASHDIVYYNGHSHGGAIDITPGGDYRILVLDSCWSTQHFATRLVGDHRDVITNDERSVTGSIDSFFVLLDALRERAPQYPLAAMNALAEQRARVRAPLSRFKQPEHYRLARACPADASRAERPPGDRRRF